MRKILLLFISACISTFPVLSQNDTLHFSSDIDSLDYYGNFDDTFHFPTNSDTYRQILMTVELGQYNCPAGTQYCHQWDYDIEMQLMDPADSSIVELGRFVTPYATAGWSRFGSSWKQPYVFDVTDFYPLLKGDKVIRIHYAGYSGGFTAQVKFDFIKGTPARPVLGIAKAFTVNHSYGDANDPFNDYLTEFKDKAPTGTVSARMKVIVSGHGSDDNQCCEFQSHYYTVSLENNQIDKVTMWRDNCGVNNLYPQGGTWIYNRANWCPGAKVVPLYTELPGVSSEDSIHLDMNFENYTGSGTLGSYKLSALVFYYGARNNTVDAAITDVITPTNNPNHYRANPSNARPKIEVKNTGKDPITSIDFKYGVNGSLSSSDQWTGTINPGETKIIQLAKSPKIEQLSLDEAQGLQTFKVIIEKVNGQTDGEADNNAYTTHFKVAPKWNFTVVLNLQTNTLGANGYFNATPSDVSWKITDMEGNVVFKRTNTKPATTYNDTITFMNTGMYKLTLTSVNCLGLHWWPLDQQPAYDAGYFNVKDLSGNKEFLKNYTYSGTEHDDWGCKYTQYFSVDATYAGIINEDAPQFIVYPNPAKETLNLRVKGKTSEYFIRLVDVLGNTVYSTTSSSNKVQLQVGNINAGVYFLYLHGENGGKSVKKVVIH